jgi:hypothetical protein
MKLFSEGELISRLKSELEQGKHAEQLRANPIFSAAFTHEKAELYDQFCKSKWYQRKLRESLWNRIQAVIALEAKLKSVEYAAKIAAQEVEKMNAKN